MLSRDPAITCIQPMCLRCDVCHHRIETDAEVDIGFLLPGPQPTALALHLRAMGSSVVDDTRRLRTCLGYLLDLMTTAHEVSRHTVLMSTDDFRHNVLDVNGSLALLLSSGWSVIDDVAIVYSRMPGEPSQRQLLAMEMLQQELQGLNEGIRTHTVPFEADLPFVTEELTALLRLFESRDMVPSLETLHRWAYLWSFFRLLTAHTRSPQYERHLMTCRHYALFVADRVRGAYHSVPLPPLPLTAGNTTPANANTPRNRSLGDGASPAIYHSPAEALVRTPLVGCEREEFSIAQPAAHLLSRDPHTQHAGLLNMRQCCFMNSVLQSYFMHPSMAPCLMSAPYNNSSTDPNVKLLHRLQALFALCPRLCREPPPLIPRRRPARSPRVRLLRGRDARDSIRDRHAG